MQTLNLNGKPVAVQAEPETPLLWVLRRCGTYPRIRAAVHEAAKALRG